MEQSCRLCLFNVVLDPADWGLKRKESIVTTTAKNARPVTNLCFVMGTVHAASFIMQAYLQNAGACNEARLIRLRGRIRG